MSKKYSLNVKAINEVIKEKHFYQFAPIPVLHKRSAFRLDNAKQMLLVKALIFRD